MTLDQLPEKESPALGEAGGPTGKESKPVDYNHSTLRDDPHIRKMNAKHCVLTAVGGKCRVTSVGLDAFNRETIVLQTPADFYNAYAHEKIDKGPRNKRGDPTAISIAKYWFVHPERRQARSLCYRPGLGGMVNGDLNLWRGFGVQPKAGDWSLMRSHIRDVLAGGEPTADSYIVRWTAWAIQHPGEPAETVICFRGGKGSGKGMFATAIKDLFGRHGLMINNPRHLTGNFNSHLAECSLLFADEALAANDKTAESVLKTVVTSRTLPIERKGIDVIEERNSLHIIMASNESWVVPASLDERRFAVFDVSDQRVGDRDYFSALAHELENGGLEAMLHDLRAMDLGDWHPRYEIPNTAGLTQQKLKSLRGMDRVVYSMLSSGRALGFLKDFPDGGIFVSTAAATGEAGKDPTHQTAMGRALAKCLAPGVSGERRNIDGVRQRGYLLPPIGDARHHWAVAMGLDIRSWPDVDGWEQGEAVGGEWLDVHEAF